MIDEGVYIVVQENGRSPVLEKCEEEDLDEKPNGVFIAVESNGARLILGYPSNKEQENFARSKFEEINQSLGIETQSSTILEHQDLLELQSEVWEPSAENFSWKPDRGGYPLASVRVLSASRSDETAGECHEHCGGFFTRGLVEAFQSESKVTWRSLLTDTRMLVELSVKPPSLKDDAKGSQLPQIISNTAPDIDKPVSFCSHRNSQEYRTKSLLIGINYNMTEAWNTLRGCHKDVILMKELIRKHGFNTEDHARCRELVDDVKAQEKKDRQPTFRNILRGLLWLTDEAKAGDSLLLHYSGHGVEEDDDWPEAAPIIIPVDGDDHGVIRKDFLIKLLCGLPEGVVVTIIADSCHSGSFLDLPFRLSAN